MKKAIVLSLALALSACGGTKVVDLDSQREVAGMSHVMELEYRDWTRTAENMIDSMLKSGAFVRVKDPVIAMGPMINDTMQRFDTDILVKKIRSDLVNSGRAQIATSFQNRTVTETKQVPASAEIKAASISGKHSSNLHARVDGYMELEYEKPTSEDDSTHQMRALRGNEEYAAGSIADRGTLVAPNMSLSGKMLQRNLKIDSGWLSSRNERVEYYLQLTMTDLKTGLSVWEDEQPILKEGRQAPRW
ncbi:MAG: hypothetical protein FWG80_04380 [Alphaproteobacteria bacterium]|nr:hypothetical protein [Alphaproteobacteria bacterium]